MLILIAFIGIYSSFLCELQDKTDLILKCSPLYTAKKGLLLGGPNSPEFGVPATEFGRVLSEIEQTLPKAYLWFRFQPNSAHMLIFLTYTK